jgi:hypothetical protein
MVAANHAIVLGRAPGMAQEESSARIYRLLQFKREGIFFATQT